MRLRVSLVLGIAAMGLLIGPGAAAAGPPGYGNWPAGNYARGSTPNDCTAPIQAPVQVALVGFANAAQAKNVIETETNWFQADPGIWHLEMKDGAASGDPSQCLGETHGRVSTNNPDATARNYLKLWNNATSAVVAGAPVRQRKTTNDCGASAADPKWVTSPGGYLKGRQSFETAFAGSTPAETGPYPVAAVQWGNTATIQQCDGTSVSGDGWVDVIRPKDDFGFNDNFGPARDDLFRAPLPPSEVDPQTGESPTYEIGTCPQPVDVYYPAIKQSVINQLQAAGVTTARFGLQWSSVAPCSGAPRADWEWGRWDQTIPQLASAGIKPIVVAGWPGPQGPGGPGGPDPVWANQCGVPAGDDGLIAWRRFIDDIASQYGGQLKGIEIWNEQNLENYWGGCPPSIATYAQILHYAIEGVEASSHPNVKIVVGGLFPDPGNLNPGIQWEPYLEGLMTHLSTADKEALDAVGFHPYRTATHLGQGADVATSAREQVTDVRIALATFGVAPPVWVTEVGTTTVQARDQFGNPIPTPPYVGQDDWAQGLADRAVYDALRNTGVETTIIHEYVDEAGDGPRSAYGVVDKPTPPDTLLTPKAAYCLLADERGAGTPGTVCSL